MRLTISSYNNSEVVTKTDKLIRFREMCFPENVNLSCRAFYKPRRHGGSP
jgi:hypothetical protein